MDQIGNSVNPGNPVNPNPICLWSKQYSWYANENLQLITDGISGVGTFIGKNSGSYGVVVK